jgi:hypothetical protein
MHDTRCDAVRQFAAIDMRIAPDEFLNLAAVAAADRAVHAGAPH